MWNSSFMVLSGLCQGNTTVQGAFRWKGHLNVVQINDRVTENGSVVLGSHQGIIAHLIKILSRCKAVSSVSTTFGYRKCRTQEMTACARQQLQAQQEVGDREKLRVC